MSKYQLDSSPIYIDGTDIPKNKLNITDSELIHEIEQNLLTQAYEQFSAQVNTNTVFDEKYFVNLHKKTLESLYDFAGLYRNVNMSKGDSQFCLAEYLQNESARIFNALKDDNYLFNIADKKEFAVKLAYYQGELIALHPFYEVNGRILRLFFDMLCIYNDYDTIDYTDSIANGKYIQASIESVQYADTSKLEEIIFNGLKKR